jgi:hypothetical protein
MALGTATRKMIWVRNLSKDVLKKDYIVHLFCSNQSALHVAVDDSSRKRTQYTDCDFYITNESLFQNKTILTWIPTANQLADIFMKALGREVFDRMKKDMMGGSS